MKKNNKPKINLDLNVTDAEISINFKQISIILTFLKYIEVKRLYNDKLHAKYQDKMSSKDEECEYIDTYKKYYKIKYNQKHANDTALQQLKESLHQKESKISYNALYYLRFRASIEYGFETKLEDIENEIKAIKEKWKITSKHN